MSQKRLCYVCRERPAEVPDRYTTGRQIARICRECHADRLRQDLRRFAAARSRRLANDSITGGCTPSGEANGYPENQT